LILNATNNETVERWQKRLNAFNEEYAKDFVYLPSQWWQ